MLNSNYKICCIVYMMSNLMNARISLASPELIYRLGSKFVIQLTLFCKSCWTNLRSRRLSDRHKFLVPCYKYMGNARRLWLYIYQKS
ncbi:hypothetical protein VNO80_23074 [Phaseolus coccineus]|uniref:Uncharacterized protein n=1 Tax=Phaseolus coccineus TaxID=3886 RepID=A0AAN9QVI9_PHACN